MPDAATERRLQGAYDRASDSWSRHMDRCERACGAYHGPPLEACAAGDTLIRKMLGAAERLRASRQGPSAEPA